MYLFARDILSTVIYPELLIVNVTSSYVYKWIGNQNNKIKQMKNNIDYFGAEYREERKILLWKIRANTIEYILFKSRRFDFSLSH